MTNKISRNAKKLYVTFNTNTYNDMIVEKNEYGEWIGTDTDGKKWSLLISLLRNGDFCKVTVIK